MAGYFGDVSDEELRIKMEEMQKELDERKKASIQKMKKASKEALNKISIFKDIFDSRYPNLRFNEISIYSHGENEVIYHLYFNRDMRELDDLSFHYSSRDGYHICIDDEILIFGETTDAGEFLEEVDTYFDGCLSRIQNLIKRSE